MIVEVDRDSLVSGPQAARLLRLSPTTLRATGLEPAATAERQPLYRLGDLIDLAAQRGSLRPRRAATT